MSNSVIATARKLSFVAVPAIVFGLLQGCLSYQESGELFDDGSGEVRIVFGLPNDNQDPDKVREIRQSVKHLRGLHWIADVDSLSSGRHWHGGVLHFDSLAALRQLNALLPMEQLFGGLKATVTDSGTSMHRLVKLPADSKDDHETMTISWKLPGTVVSTDRHAKREEGSNLVRWNFPTDGSGGETARMDVRWEARTVPVSLWTKLPKNDLEWSSIGLAFANFLFAVIAAFVARGRVAAMRRKLAKG